MTRAFDITSTLAGLKSRDGARLPLLLILRLTSP
jgi:hypothetical protein